MVSARRPDRSDSPQLRDSKNRDTAARLYLHLPGRLGTDSAVRPLASAGDGGCVGREEPNLSDQAGRHPGGLGMQPLRRLSVAAFHGPSCTQGLRCGAAGNSVYVGGPAYCRASAEKHRWHGVTAHSTAATSKARRGRLLLSGRRHRCPVVAVRKVVVPEDEVLLRFPGGRDCRTHCGSYWLRTSVRTRRSKRPRMSQDHMDRKTRRSCSTGGGPHA